MTLGVMANFSKEAFVDLLAQSGLSQSTLAARVGVSKAVVSYWATGKHRPAAVHAPLIANALNCKVMDLAGKRDANDVDLVDMRYIRGFTALEVAELANLSPEQMSNLEQAVSMPNQEHLRSLARTYETSSDDIRRAWVARRVNLHGVEALDSLDKETAAKARYRRNWVSYYRRRGPFRPRAVAETPAPAEVDAPDSSASDYVQNDPADRVTEPDRKRTLNPSTADEDPDMKSFSMTSTFYDGEGTSGH